MSVLMCVCVDTTVWKQCFFNNYMYTDCTPRKCMLAILTQWIKWKNSFILSLTHSVVTIVPFFLILIILSLFYLYFCLFVFSFWSINKAFYGLALFKISCIIMWGFVFCWMITWLNSFSISYLWWNSQWYCIFAICLP